MGIPLYPNTRGRSKKHPLGIPFYPKKHGWIKERRRLKFSIKIVPPSYSRTWFNKYSFISCMVVEFTKELKIINKIPTKYWSFFISLILLVITNLVANTFKYVDIVLYILTSISISLGSNGLSNFNNGKKESK